MELKLTNSDFQKKVEANRLLKKSWPRIDVSSVQFANLKDDNKISPFHIQRHYNNALISVAIDALPIKQQIGFDALRFSMGKTQLLKLNLCVVDSETLYIGDNEEICIGPKDLSKDPVFYLDKTTTTCNLFTDQDYSSYVIVMLVDLHREEIIEVYELEGDDIIDYIRDKNGLDEEVMHVKGSVPLRYFVENGKKVSTAEMSKVTLSKWADFLR